MARATAPLVVTALRAFGVRSAFGISAYVVSAAAQPGYIPLAKGYAIDEIARLLESRNVENYLIELGGELKAGGGPHGETAWRVGLEVPDPHLVGAVRRTISLQDQAVATSGGYRHFYSMSENQVIRHIIAPRTGRPVDHGLVSVSVICDSAMRAAALATALMVLEPLRGYAFAVENNLAATLVWRTGGELREQSTPAFESYVP